MKKKRGLSLIVALSMMLALISATTIVNADPGVNHKITGVVTGGAGGHGTIDNVPPIMVQDQGGQFIFITPDYGYEVSDVTIAGTSSGTTSLDDNAIQSINRDGGYNIQGVNENKTITVTFAKMDPLPPAFTQWGDLKTRIEGKLFAYSGVTDAAACKTAFTDDLWDLISHEYQGAFINKAALGDAITIDGTNPLSTDTTTGLTYYTYTVNLANNTLQATGSIYVLQDNNILIKSDRETKLVDLGEPTPNSRNELTYGQKSAVIDYNNASSIQFGGARVEGRVGSTDYCVAYHLSLTNAGCVFAVFNQDFEGAIAQCRGENKVAFAWDFGNTPFIAFNDTTAADPFVLETFFGFSSVKLVPEWGGETINDIVITGVDCSLPSAAVSITDPDTIAFNSNYFDTIPLTVSYTQNGTPQTGYITIKRTGIDIKDYSKTGGATTCQTNHGTQPGIVFDWGSNDFAIYASYYYPSSSDYNVDIFCTYTWADGTTTTKLIANSEATRSGNPDDDFSTPIDDFCVYKGSSANKPVKVSVIAVNSNALNNTTEFGGAAFGAGAGVEWIFNR